MQCGWQVYGTSSRGWSGLRWEVSRGGPALEPHMPHGDVTCPGSFGHMNSSGPPGVLFMTIYQRIVTHKLTELLFLVAHLQKEPGLCVFLGRVQ